MCSSRRASSPIVSTRATRLVLAPDQRRAILAHAAERESEVCGVLAGMGDTVTRVIPMRNAAEDRHAGRFRRAAATGFVIDPLELRDVFDDLERTGERVLAYYHSHPAGARPEPSHTDVSDARSSGEHRSALFVVAWGSEVAAFAIDDDDVTRVEISPA